MSTRFREVSNLILIACGTILAGLGMFVVMFTLFGPIVIAGAMVIGGMIAFGALHYLTWGMTMENEVAAERPEPPEDDD